MLAGAWLNISLPGVMRRLKPFAPLLAAGMTVLVSASIVAQNAPAVQSAGLRLVLAVACLHLGKNIPLCLLARICVMLHLHGRAALLHACMMRSSLGRHCQKASSLAL